MILVLEYTMGGLTGKVALVTGGSRGIGAAIAKRLAADGADVAVTYVSSATGAQATVDAIKAIGCRAIAIKADSVDATAVAAAVDKTAAEFGRLDILVNNAGIYDTKPIEQFSVADFDRMVAVNLRAAFAGTKAAVAHMKDGGRVVSIGSGLAERMPFPGVAVYSMTKAAIAALMQGLARELGPRGITVNTVHPGSIDTDMNPADGPYADFQRSLSAVGRYGKADEIAAAVAYLASSEAAFVTGADLKVDGGFCA
jgi:3-oxoacyl-[acyl-carrier protein] reductase